MNSRLFVCLCLGLAVVLAGFAQGADPALLDRISAHFAQIKDFRADYRRLTTASALDNVFLTAPQDRASGELMFMKPDLLRLDQRTPDHQVLATDGQTLWWHIARENTVYRYQGQEYFLELRPILDFLSGLGRLADHYRVVDLNPDEESPALYKFKLFPLAPGPTYTSLTVWITAEGLDLAGFQITNALGETTDFTLTNVRLNNGFSRNDFVFHTPNDALIIDND